MDQQLADRVLNGKRGIALSEREGTFIHSYECQVCGLNFTIYSWRKKRNRDCCPECGYTFMYHMVKKVDGEIFEYHFLRDNEIANDSVLRWDLKVRIENMVKQNAK